MTGESVDRWVDGSVGGRRMGRWVQCVCPSEEQSRERDQGWRTQ